MSNVLLRLFAVTMLACCVSCSKTRKISPPSINPDIAADEALSLYDDNSDGMLNEQELVDCPAMLAMLSAYDADGSGSVDRQEIVAHIEEMWGHRVGLTQLQCAVRYNGRPLRDAIVEFDPEPYLGEGLVPAQGITDKSGYATIKIPDDQLPSELRGLPGLRYGTYKVRITHPKLKLPARFNDNTTLGFETTVGNRHASFSLKGS
jgi:hypothetical protein